MFCLGTKALDKTHTTTSHVSGGAGNGVSFVTVFTVYNNTSSFDHLKSSSIVSVVGNVIYSKPERSMAVLNAFAYFIQVMCRPADNFSQLVDLFISLCDSGCLEQLMLMLKTNPKLKSLTICSEFKNVPLMWNTPDHVPECLASHLEFFQWISYEGKKEERELMAYILANSKCLKEAYFILKCNNLDDGKKGSEELLMSKISPICRLVSI